MTAPKLRRFKKEELQEFRKKLEARIKQLLATEKRLEEESLVDLAEDTTDELSHIRLHAADLGTEEYEQNLLLSLAESEIREIQDIEEALSRIQNETYGVCLECGKEISDARLEALPYARHCGPCQKRLEKIAQETSHQPTIYRD